MNYNQLIEKTIIPARLTIDEKMDRYEEVITYVNSILPQKLYRFRSVNEKTLSALYNDELWFTNGSMMNDDFDARLYYDKKQIIDWLNSQMTTDGIFKVLEDLSTIDKMPVEMSLVIPNADMVFMGIKNMTRDQKIDISGRLIKYILDNLDEELMYSVNQVQEMTKFACFSEKINSDMMWGQYANNATGFALEYEFGDVNSVEYYDERDNRFRISGNLFPIVYGNRRMDTTRYVIYLFQILLLNRLTFERGISLPKKLINMLLECPDEFMATKVAIKKSNEWKQEKEWRMFYVTYNQIWTNEKCSCVKQKASAIYLGRKISDINQKILMGIAKEKDIPVYKMDFNVSSIKYRLKSMRIQ